MTHHFSTQGRDFTGYLSTFFLHIVTINPTSSYTAQKSLRDSEPIRAIVFWHVFEHCHGPWLWRETQYHEYGIDIASSSAVILQSIHLFQFDTLFWPVHQPLPIYINSSEVHSGSRAHGHEIFRDQILISESHHQIRFHTLPSQICRLKLWHGDRVCGHVTCAILRV